MQLHMCAVTGFFLLHGLQLHPKIIPITTYQGTGILLLTYSKYCISAKGAYTVFAYSYLMLALLGLG